MQSLVSVQHDRKLILDFNQVGDRFHHTLRIAHETSDPADGEEADASFTGLATTMLLASVEGNPDDDWPASPVWQELSIETINDRPVALLTGQTTTCYWSTSIEVDPASGDFVFDSAARLSKQPPESHDSDTFVGSSYCGQTQNPDQPIVERISTMDEPYANDFILRGPDDLRVRLYSLDNTAALARQLSSGDEPASNVELAITPTEFSTDRSGRSSTRWKYAIGLVSLE